LKGATGNAVHNGQLASAVMTASAGDGIALVAAVAAPAMSAFEKRYLQSILTLDTDTTV